MILEKINIGNTVEEKEIIVSPKVGLRDTILGQGDMAKRSLDISRFVTAFTREANIEAGESNYWFYCIKTNAPLLPTFIHKLAITYLKKW